MQGFDNNPALAYNEELAEIYREWIKENPIQTGGWGTWPANHPEMPVSEELAAEAAKVSDTAVVVIGRAAGEDRELTYEEIKLTDDEKTMLFNVNKYFENIIVLMNVGNVIDMSWRTDYDNIKSVVYVWQVLNSVHPEYIDVSGGTLNITTDIGERHQIYTFN